MGRIWDAVPRRRPPRPDDGPPRRDAHRPNDASHGAAGASAIPGVQIEYRPQRDGDPDPGEVVWTWVPFEEDPTLGKDRPVVIVGHHGEDLSGVALTTKRTGRSNQVEVGSGAWDPRGRPSYAKVDRLLDIEPTRSAGRVRRSVAAASTS